MTAEPPVWGEAARGLAEHLFEVPRDESGWNRVLRCPTTATEWLEDYPFSELQGGGPTRLRSLALASACGCEGTLELAGDDAAAYEREHLVWVRHLGDGVNLWVCADGLAVWDDEARHGRRLLLRVWLTKGERLRPMLAFSTSRGW